MKVLLIYPGSAFISGKGEGVPLGLCQLVSILQAENHEVKGIDLSLKSESCYLQAPEAVKKDIIDFSPDLVGINCDTLNRFNAIYWAEITKELCPQSKVILGGPHATFCPEDLLHASKAIDYIALHEADESLPQLCKDLEKGKNEPGFPGLIYRQGNKIIRTGKAERIKDLDQLPLPDRKIFPVEDYNLHFRSLPKGNSAHLITSRGCPFRCRFCASSFFWEARVCFRSPGHVIAELEMLAKKHRIKSVIFYDDALTCKKSRLAAICEGIIQKKLDIKWMCWSRVDGINHELLSMMRQAGCRAISFGLESGSQEMLDKIQKGTKIAQIEAAVAACFKAKISPRASFIIGMPGETFEMAKETVNLISRLKIHPNTVMIYWHAFIFPGTEWFTNFKLKNPDFTWFETLEKYKEQSLLDPKGNILVPYNTFSQPEQQVLLDQLEDAFFNYSRFKYLDYTLAHAWPWIKLKTKLLLGTKPA